MKNFVILLSVIMLAVFLSCSRLDNKNWYDKPPADVVSQHDDSDSGHKKPDDGDTADDGDTNQDDTDTVDTDDADTVDTVDTDDADTVDTVDTDDADTVDTDDADTVDTDDADTVDTDDADTVDTVDTDDADTVPDSGSDDDADTDTVDTDDADTVPDSGSDDDADTDTVDTDDADTVPDSGSDDDADTVDTDDTDGDDTDDEDDEDIDGDDTDIPDEETYEVGWSNFQYPDPEDIFHINAGEEQTYYGRVLVVGITDLTPGVSEATSVKAKFGCRPADSSEEFDWNDASINEASNPDFGNNDEFAYTYSFPNAGSFECKFRYSVDGSEWKESAPDVTEDSLMVMVSSTEEPDDDADTLEPDDDADTVDTDDADSENDDDADTVDTDDADSENDDDADTVDTDDADSENDDDADTVDTDDADSENDDDADTVDTDDADSENDDDADTVDTDDADSENDDDADTVDDCTYIPNYDFSEWNATANNSPTGWITKSTASYEKIVRDGEDYALRVYKTAITSNNPYVLDTPFFIPEDYAAIPTKLTFDLKTNITSRISINLRCGAGNNTDDFYAYNWDSTSESFEWNNKTNAYNKDINLGSDFKEIALIISSNVEADFWRGKQCRFEFKFGGKNEADITIDNLVLHTEEGACIKDDEGDNDDDDSDDNDGITDEDENDDDDGITDEDENDDDDEITDEDENPVYEISGAYIVRPKIPQTVSVGESVNVVVGAVKVVGITDKTLNESDDAAGEYIEAQLCTKEASAADYADENCVEAGISDYPCDLHDSYMANTKVFGSAGEYTVQYRFRVKNETWSEWEYSENQIQVTVLYKISGAYIVRPKIPQTVSVGESVNVVVGAVKVVGITDKTLNESDDAAGEYIEAQLCTKEASAADYADENCVEAGISDYPCDLHDSYMANTKVFGSAGEYTMQYRFRVKNETWSKWEYSENQITVTVSYKIKEGEGTPYIDRPTGSKTVNLNNPLKNVVGGVYVEGLTNITSGEPDDPDGNIIEAEVCIKDADAANYADTDCVKAVANDKDLGTDDAYIANTKVFESVGKYTVQYRFRLKGNQKWVYSKNQITVTVPQQIANADFSEWEDESTPKSWIEGGITSEESQNPGIFSKECDETGDCALKVSAKRGKNEEVSSQIVFTSPDFIIDNDVLPEKINFNLKTDDTKTMVLFIKWHCDGDESYSNLSLFKWEIANSTLDRPEGFFLHPEPDEFYALYEPEGKNVSALFVIEMNSNREAFSEYSLGKTCRLKFLYSDSKSRKAVEHWAIFDDFQIVYPEPED